MSKVNFVQFLPKLLGDNPILKYHEEVRSYTPGYENTINYGLMEIPTWIPRIAGMLADYIDRELVLVQNMGELLDYFWNNAHDDYMFSVMDVNKELVRYCLNLAPDTAHFFLGGYVDPAYFSVQLGWSNVHWLEKPEQLNDFFEVDFSAPPDYGLFNGWKTIPRLTLSEGCLFDCHFCTIDRKIKVLSGEEIMEQLRGILNTGLEFELIYISDKTFGQASNWEYLRQVNHIVRNANPNFKGFIVQTTANMPIKKVGDSTLLEIWYDMGVRYVEIGVETPDDRLLQKLNKPYRSATLKKMTELFRSFQKMALIPNIIFGIPTDDYVALGYWLRENRDIIEFINPTILADYFNGKGQVIREEDRVSDVTVNDIDQNTFSRSWLTEREQKLATQILEEVLRLTAYQVISRTS